MAHSTCIIQFRADDTVSIITEVPNLRLDGKTIASFAADVAAMLPLVRAACEEAFDASLETHEAKERTPGTQEYAAKQLEAAQDREASAVALLVEHGAAKDEDEARAMVAAKTATETKAEEAQVAPAKR